MVTMTPTLLVLASIGLGLVAGSLATAVVFGARSLGRKRAASTRPELPPAAIEMLHALDRFAVILDASLSPVYANPAARDDSRITGEQLSEPEFLRRSRQVMSTGVTDVIAPEEATPFACRSCACSVDFSWSSLTISVKSSA